MKDQDNPRNLAEWLGLTTRPDFSAAKRFGRVVGAMLTVIAIIIFAAMLTLVLGVAFATFDVVFGAGGVNSEDIRNIGLVLAALIGAPFLVWRTMVAAKQVAISDEALFNDKINAAAQDLAARRQVTRPVKQNGEDVILSEIEDDLVTRAAAIDRLEALTHERPEMAPRIDRLLATYVRGTFPHEGLERRAVPRMDLQRAIDAIGRIHKLAVKVDPSRWRLDLKGCNFDGVSFASGHFWAADFSNCRFEASILRNGSFEGAFFRHSLMNFVDFHQTNLIGAKLDWVTISKPGGLFGGLQTKKLKGVTFIGANLTGLRHVGNNEVLISTFGTKDTTLSGEIRSQIPHSDKWQRAHFALNALTEGQDVSKDDLLMAKILKKSGLQNWSPFPSDDLATGHLLSELYENLAMKSWPYWES